MDKHQYKLSCYQCGPKALTVGLFSSLTQAILVSTKNKKYATKLQVNKGKNKEQVKYT